MAESDPQVTIRIGADTSGADKANTALKKVKGESDGVVGAMDKLKGGVERARGALMSLGGVTAIVSSLVRIFKDLSASAVEVAAELDKVRADAAAKSIAQIADEEKRANEEIARGNALRERAQTLDEKRAAAVRRVQDAELRAAKAKELAAVGNGPDADLRRQEIEQKYAGNADYITISREKSDADRRARALGDQANAAEKEAAEKEARAAEFAALAKSESRAASRASARAVQEAKNDAVWKFWSNGAENAKLLTGNAAVHNTNAETANGNAEQLKKEAAALREKARSLKEERKAVEETSSKVFEAEYKALVANDAEVQLGIRREQESRNEKREKEAREKEKEAREREREAREVASARSGMADTQAQIETAKRRLQEVQEKRSSNDLSIARAGDAFELAKTNGRPMREQAAAYGQRQQIVRRAQDANHELDKAEAEILGVLETLNTRLKNFERVVQQGGKRAKAESSDAQGGV